MTRRGASKKSIGAVPAEPPTTSVALTSKQQLSIHLWEASDGRKIVIGELQDLERKNPGSGAALHACAKRIKAGTLRPADVLSLKGTELLEMRVEVGNRQFRLLYVLEQTADADVALILCLYPFTKSERTPPTAVRTAESRLTEYRSRRPGVA